jgi:predicted nucleic acid-binding protein
VAERYVLDTSAILAFVGDEPGADRVERLLRGARMGRHEVLVCSITLMELFYTAIRAKGEDAAVRLVALVNAWPLAWVYPDERVLLQAGRLNASHRLSVADALVAAVARTQGATLVHKDPEMEPLRGQVDLLSLHSGGKR